MTRIISNLEKLHLALENEINFNNHRYKNQYLFLIQTEEDFYKFYNDYYRQQTGKPLMISTLSKFRRYKIRNMKMTFNSFMELYSKSKRNALEQLTQKTVRQWAYERINSYIASGDNILTLFLSHKFNPQEDVSYFLNYKSIQDSLNIDIDEIKRKSCDPEEVISASIEDGVMFFDEEDYLPYKQNKEGKLKKVEINNQSAEQKEELPSYKEIKIKDRKGQQQFRESVLEAYDNQCAITREKCTCVIQAAHIFPHINEHSNNVSNGIPLRADLHLLFDQWLLTIDENLLVRVNPKVTSGYYRSLDKLQIHLPKDKQDYPAIESIEYRRVLFNSKIE
ncbi:HNH endonuclease [Cytobacillus firmus]|uniref:HNH endonuclease n=1 Tax=Cytobacillus firmus TaxID=1399 RepID=UPI0030015FEF